MFAKIQSAKQHARRMNKEFQLDSTFLEDLMKKQNGKCNYSGLPMFLGPDVVDWKCTIERLDDSIGYLKDNVVLCCHEFNVAAKWTPAKITAVWTLRQQAVDLEALQSVLQCLKGKRRRADRQRVWRDLSHLSAEQHAMVVFVQQMARHAKGAAKARSNRTRKRKADTSAECSIDEHTIVDKFEQQGGRCYISNIPLVLESNVDWRCSLERLDNAKGYTDENTVLVCLEFNGPAQWTRAKFSLFERACSPSVSMAEPAEPTTDTQQRTALQQLADAGLAATAQIQARLQELNRKAAARAATSSHCFCT
jgi:hypothetical protein